MVDNIVGWLARRDEAMSSVQAGEPLRWRVAATPAAGDRIRGPDGQFLPAQRAGAVMTAADTGAPGVYATGDGRLFAVNPITEGESDLSSPRAQPIERETESDGSAAASRREIAALLLAAALLVLALEWWYRGRWAVQA